MDIKELDKKQLILLTLLITFVVSIATGIITVSLMNQMPKSVPQTINNVIQRTIEKVTTVEVPTSKTASNNTSSSTVPQNSSTLIDNNSDALISIYPISEAGVITEPVALGQGVIISDIGLILVDSSILTEVELYKVVLNKIDFNASVLKKFGNGFAILKISKITNTTTENKDTSTSTTTQ